MLSYAGEAVPPPSGNVYAEAFAFRMLVRHLQKVSSQASNIDVMGAAGMCRNCLAKWYHAGTVASGQEVSYEEACERIYGEPYGSWKKTYQKPATEDQLARFEATKDWHARHEKDLAAWKSRLSVAADPCCYVEDDDENPREPSLSPPLSSSALRIGVLTVSDRASTGAYEDQSGPAVVEEARNYGAIVSTAVVPDERDEIERTLTTWADDACNLVLTTGGTGFGPRDVTPEATQAVTTKHAPGIISIVHAAALADLSAASPSSSSSSSSGSNKREKKATPPPQQQQQQNIDSLLSRATAGVRGACLIVNLPGRPAAAKRNLAILMPTLAKAVALASPG